MSVERLRFKELTLVMWNLVSPYLNGENRPWIYSQRKGQAQRPCSRVEGWRPRGEMMGQLMSEDSLEAYCLLTWEISVFLLRPLTYLMRPTHVMGVESALFNLMI